MTVTCLGGGLVLGSEQTLRERERERERERAQSWNLGGERERERERRWCTKKKNEIIKTIMGNLHF